MLYNTEKRSHLEKAIRDRYGEDAVKNPASTVDEKRKEELEAEFREDEERWDNYKPKEEISEREGFVVVDRKVNFKFEGICQHCKKEGLLFTSADQFYYNKYNCCEKCYYVFEQ